VVAGQLQLIIIRKESLSIDQDVIIVVEAEKKYDHYGQ
jgi:hypothetical protein